MRGNHPQTSPPHPGHPGRSAAESRDLSPIMIGSQSPHPEEQTRLGLRLEGRGLAGPDGPPCWNPASFETPCAAAWLLRMRGRGLILSTPPLSSRPQRSEEPGSQPYLARITIPSS